MGSPYADEAFLTQGLQDEEIVVHEYFPFVVCFVGRPQKHVLFARQKLKLCRYPLQTVCLDVFWVSTLFVSIQVQSDVRDDVWAFPPQQ